MPDTPDQTTSVQKKRLSLTWLSGSVFWLAITVPLSSWLHHHFPNIEPETAMTVEGAIGAPLAVFLAFLFHRLVLVKVIRDSNKN